MIARDEALRLAEGWLVSHNRHRLVVGKVVELRNHWIVGTNSRSGLILNRDERGEWLPGIHGALAKVAEAEQGITNFAQAFLDVRSLYGTMHRGPGGFGDFFIRRDTAQERQVANAELEQVAEELWRLLGCE